MSLKPARKRSSDGPPDLALRAGLACLEGGRSMDTLACTYRPEGPVDRQKILTWKVLNIFSSQELIRELRSRNVIVGDHFQTLAPGWIVVTPPEEEPS